MCDLDISMVVRDKEMDKFTLYNSGTKQMGLFTHERATDDLRIHYELQRSIKVFTDDEYKLLSKMNKQEADEQTSNPKDEQEIQSMISN